MKKATIIFVVYMFLFANQANPQTFTNYSVATTSTTLSNNEVTAIAIDAQGNKWFGTVNGGVLKFDGVKWTTYTTADGLAYNTVNAIAIDAQGNKWFGTNGRGVSNVLTPQIAGHNLKNKLGLIKFGNYDNNKEKIYS